MIKILLVVLILSLGGFFLFKPQVITNQTEQVKNTDEPQLKLKSIGVEFSDFKFTNEKLQFNRLFMDYGFMIPASPDNPSKANPQSTFILPLGTPVRSLVDGVVAAMPTLWSGDISIQVTKTGKLERWIYETEHVKNVLVKVGDKVKAGQIIAEVSDFDKGAPAGFGAVEIGILKGGNPPQHVCPFQYLDPSIKEEIQKKITAFYKSWEEYIGENNLYNETALTSPGCLSSEAIDG